MSADKALEGLEEQRKRKRGGQLTYTEEVAERVLKLMASGLGLATIHREHGGPPPQTVRDWATDDVAGFGGRYARALLLRMHHMGDEIVELADDETLDPNSRRVRVDARKWVMSKLAPATYGDKLQHEHSGTVTLSALLLGAEEPAVRVIEAKAEPPEGEDAG